MILRILDQLLSSAREENEARRRMMKVHEQITDIYLDDDKDSMDQYEQIRDHLMLIWRERERLSSELIARFESNECTTRWLIFSLKDMFSELQTGLWPNNRTVDENPLRPNSRRSTQSHSDNSRLITMKDRRARRICPCVVS